MNVRQATATSSKSHAGSMREYAGGTITCVLIDEDDTHMNATDSDDVIARRTIDTDQDAPATQIVELVSDLENREPTDLTPIYYSIDELLDDLFSSPPRAEAEASLEFTYEGYQFRVRQDGVTTVSNRGQPAPG
jgi:hypothetical protein